MAKAIINVHGADSRALGQKTDSGADCLVVAWKAVGQGKASARGKNTPSAKAEWANTPGKHPKALPPHPGYPGYWSGPAGYGDVAIYLGDGKWAGIDSLNGKYHEGTINVQTTAQRTAQVGGEYLGYSSEMLGYDLTWSAPAPVPPHPTVATQRQAGPTSINARKAPSTTSPIDAAHAIGAGDINDFGSTGGYAIGQKVTVGKITSNVWFVSHGGLFYAAAAFTSQSTASLPNRTPAPPATKPPVVTPPVVTPPVVVPPVTTPVEVDPPVETSPVDPPTDPVVVDPPVDVPPVGGGVTGDPVPTDPTEPTAPATPAPSPWAGILAAIAAFIRGLFTK